MANSNDVTLATLNTTAISADSVQIQGKSIDTYISEKSTGTKVFVEPKTTSGTLIATISCDGTPKDIYAPNGGNREYTAFEVFITDKVISAGMADTNEPNEVSSVANLFGFDNTTATGLKYTVDVPVTPDMKVSIELKAANGGADVQVNWGDGIVQSYSECYDGSKYVVHTYTKSGKYIIKVYGSVSAFRPKFTEDAGNNPISRMWEMDLPMAQSVWNLYSLAEDSYKLLRVKVPTYNYVWTPTPLKISRAFHTCKNLLSFEMGKNGLPVIMQMDKLFCQSDNLKTINWDPDGIGKFPHQQQNAFTFFYGSCPSITSKLVNLLPTTAGWGINTINVSGMFGSCSSIPAMTSAEEQLVGKLLWNNTFYNYSGQSSAFSGCSDALRAQIPTTWGGTKVN